MNSNKKTYCVLMRGGTSKGPFFLKKDLPDDTAERDAFLLKVMGSPHVLQVDGIGGGQAQTSKVAIISPSERDDADVDYLFAQVLVDEGRVDTSPNCGNMLSGVGPFAIEEGLIEASEAVTRVRIYNINTGSVIHAEVQTPGCEVCYEGTQHIDGVNGSGAPIFLHFMNAEGAKTGRFFPTGQHLETIDGIDMTLIDYSVPMMLLRASDFGLSGTESVQELDENSAALTKIEALRVRAGERLGMGDVSENVVPKVALLSPSRSGLLKSHYLMPRKCHKSHAITGAMCIASAMYVEGSLVAQLLGQHLTRSRQIAIEHPSGLIELNVVLNDQGRIASIAVVRTARRIFEGFVLA